MSPGDEAVARDAIRGLLSIYNNAGDRGRIDEMISVFDETGVLEVPNGAHKGRAAIGEYVNGVVRGEANVNLAGARHHQTTSRIDILGPDSAEGWTYFFVMRQGRIIEEGLYADRFTSADGVWSIAHRRVKVIWAGYE